VSDTRRLEVAPVRRYRPARRRRTAGIARDLAIIVGVWAVTAWPVLRLAFEIGERITR
jgi:hypothetical protein